MKYLFIISLLIFTSFESCKTQQGDNNHSAGISKQRSDSLATAIPEPSGYVNDYCSLFNQSEKKYLDSLLMSFEKKTTIEIGIAVVTTDMVSDKDFEDYSLIMMRTWGLGKKEKNNGILIVISPALRRIRIQNGYGIEPIMSDAETKKIIDNYFIPKYKEGKFFEGTSQGIIAITKKLEEKGK